MDCKIQRTWTGEYYLCIPYSYGVDNQDSIKKESLRVWSLDPGFWVFVIFPLTTPRGNYYHQMYSPLIPLIILPHTYGESTHCIWSEMILWLIVVSLCVPLWHMEWIPLSALFKMLVGNAWTSKVAFGFSVKPCTPREVATFGFSILFIKMGLKPGSVVMLLYPMKIKCYLFHLTTGQQKRTSRRCITWQTVPNATIAASMETTARFSGFLAGPLFSMLLYSLASSFSTVGTCCGLPGEMVGWDNSNSLRSLASTFSFAWCIYSWDPRSRSGSWMLLLRHEIPGCQVGTVSCLWFGHFLKPTVGDNPVRDDSRSDLFFPSDLYS